MGNSLPWISPTDQSQWVSSPASDSNDGGFGPAWDTSFDRVIGQPGFLERLGLGDISNPWAGDSGDSGGTYSLDPRILEALQSGGYEMRALPVQGGVWYSPFQGEKEMSPSFRTVQTFDEGPAWNIATGLLAGAMMPGGWAVGGTSTGIGGAAGLSGAAATGANAAFNSGLLAAGSGAEDRDIGKAMVTAGGGAFLPNIGEYAGIENPYLQNAVQGGVTGGLNALVNDGNVGSGVAMGAIPGLASYVGGVMSDNSYVPTSMGQQLINETNQSSMLPKSNARSAFVDTAPMSTIPDYVPQNSQFAYNAPKEESGFQMADLTDFFGKLMPQNAEGWGNLAQGLAGMFMGGMQYRRARELEKLLGSRRGAYEENLRRNLTRRDAASGRRSNYAGRETQLQAALAELDSRNAPAMMNLNNQQFSGLASMFGSGLRYAGKQGVFGERFTPGYNVPSATPPSSFLMSTIPMTQDVNNFDQFIGGTNDPNKRRPFRLGGM